MIHDFKCCIPWCRLRQHFSDSEGLNAEDTFQLNEFSCTTDLGISPFSLSLLKPFPFLRHYMLAAEFNSAGSQPEPRDEVDGQEGAPTSTVSSVSIPPLKPILQKTWLLGFCVFYVFFISITVFPAVSSGIQVEGLRCRLINNDSSEEGKQSC